ncbi:MAG: hypothetical protein AMJ90_05945 [candidate division Zixibacteria bacterium SM23_73_2]|nr:MAG: hypothetical protein AMJ90_05945 [candidate division Zixibacteria bacterium SM23_73_2]
MKDKKGEGDLNTIIGKGTTFDGNLMIQGGLRIDGTVKGKVSGADTISIGEDGKVEADLDAKVIIVGGKVMGNIAAKEKVELQSNSIINGDLTTRNLVVEEGAVFHGKCNMKEEKLNQKKNVDN